MLCKLPSTDNTTYLRVTYTICQQTIYTGRNYYHPHKMLLTFRSFEYIKRTSGTHSETDELVHTHATQFFKVYFNIILTFTLGIPSFLYPSCSHVFIISPILLHSHLNILDFLFPTFREWYI